MDENNKFTHVKMNSSMNILKKIVPTFDVWILSQRLLLGKVYPVNLIYLSVFSLHHN